MPDPAAFGGQLPPPIGDANAIIEQQLDRCAGELEKELEADCLSFMGGIAFGADELIRDALEARQDKRPKLALILETGGGYSEVAQRIAQTLRRHYSQVEFIVPNYAMSAGTVLAMSGDAIHMDYFSILGPIDFNAGGPLDAAAGGGPFILR